MEWRYAIVLIAGSIALVVVALPVVSERPVSAGANIDFTAVNLTAHRPWIYGKSWWFVSWIILVLLLAGTVVAAGLFASPDEAGRSASVTIDVGTVLAGTAFPGWFYGVPVLLAMVLLVGLTCFGLVRVTSLSAQHAISASVVAARRSLVRQVMGVSCGVTAFALGGLWLFAARASNLSAQLSADGAGRVEVVTPFLALQIPLTALGLLMCGVGVGLMAAAGSFRTPEFETERVSIENGIQSDVH